MTPISCSVCKEFIDQIYRPGETMPALPWPTHEAYTTPNPPFASIGNFINSEFVPADAEHHHPVAIEIPQPAYNAYARRAGTILCICESYSTGSKRPTDPSGTRRWTIRELAALQTFPALHVFCDGKVSNVNARRVIGNAVPPMLAKHIFEKVKATLEATDEDYRRRTATTVKASMSRRSTLTKMTSASTKMPPPSIHEGDTGVCKDRFTGSGRRETSKTHATGNKSCQSWKCSQFYQTEGVRITPGRWAQRKQEREKTLIWERCFAALVKLVRGDEWH
jgi:hypothetical protein